MTKISPFLRLWQYCSTIVGLIFRHPIVGVTVIPINSEGQIVLIQRRDNRLWAFPGGFVDWGEDLRQTASREILEETGFTVTEFGPLVGVYSSPRRDPRVHSISITVVAHVEGDAQIFDRGEVLAIQPFDPSELPLDLFSHDHREQLEDFFRGEAVMR